MEYWRTIKAQICSCFGTELFLQLLMISSLWCFRGTKLLCRWESRTLLCLVSPPVVQISLQIAAHNSWEIGSLSPKQNLISWQVLYCPALLTAGSEINAEMSEDFSYWSVSPGQLSWNSRGSPKPSLPPVGSWAHEKCWQRPFCLWELRAGKCRGQSCHHKMI